MMRSELSLEWEMPLNEAGRMVADTWKRMSQRFPEFLPDEFVVMPNHFHGIFQIVAAPRAGARTTGVVGAPLVGAPRAGINPAPTVGDIVGAFKSLTASQYLGGVEQFGWRRMPKGLWQRNYYEHIIRNERELEATRAYIRENPARWDTDPENVS